MNKKTLILLLSALLALVLLLGGAVYALYRKPSDAGRPAQVPSQHQLVGAVPSDAALVLSSGRLDDCLSLLEDSTKIYGALLTDSGKRGFARFTSRLVREIPRNLRSGETVISMHYSGELTPLMIVVADTGAATRSVMALADTFKLSSRLAVGQFRAIKKTSLLLVSSSETLIESCRRHLEEGLSVLDKDGVTQLLSSLGGSDALLFSNEYAGKFFTSHVGRQLYGYSPFFRKFGLWTGFAITSSTSDAARLKLAVSSGPDASYVSNMLAKLPSGSLKGADLLPAQTVFSVQLATPSLPQWLDAYKAFLDASSKMDSYRAAQVKDSTGLTPESWALKLDVKEVLKAVVRTDAGAVGLVALRPAREDSSMKQARGKVLPWTRKSFPAAEFGGLFSVPDADSWTSRDGWIVISDARTLSWLIEEQPQTLAGYMSDAGVRQRMPSGATALVYISPGENLATVSAALKPEMEQAVRSTLRGISYSPVLLAWNGSGGSLDIDRVESVRTEDPAVAEKDTAVFIPAGPFTVPNSQTGRDCLFGQSDNLTLTLKEESGKGIWGIPFKERLCGYVEPVDYYANGKIQYLFAAGSKLYLIDRLGRFVGGFPVQLGGDVLLGPGVYDFTGAHGYSAMILHKDNTLVLYDLHGRVREGWKTIRGEEKIKSLPELIEVKGKRYWAVRTSVRTQFYSFDGGEPLYGGTGSRMVRPDSPLTIKDNGSLTATCYDGRERTIKL